MPAVTDSTALLAMNEWVGQHERFVLLTTNYLNILLLLHDQRTVIRTFLKEVMGIGLSF